jgi:hypothetical protein
MKNYFLEARWAAIGTQYYHTPEARIRGAELNEACRKSIELVIWTWFIVPYIVPNLCCSVLIGTFTRCKQYYSPKFSRLFAGERPLFAPPVILMHFTVEYSEIRIVCRGFLQRIANVQQLLNDSDRDLTSFSDKYLVPKSLISRMVSSDGRPSLGAATVPNQDSTT